MTRPARAVIDLQALRHNLQRARRAAPASRIMAVIKADAYGHGLLQAAEALAHTDAFAVAGVPEAVQLREANITHPVLALQGFRTHDELAAASAHRVQVTLHHERQLQWLEDTGLEPSLEVWIKVDTGMHRLGFSLSELKTVYARVQRLPAVKSPPKLMTHLACADNPLNPATQQQLSRFDQAVASLSGEQSIANSAGVLAFPQSHRDWIRPGIMLYGASPYIDGDARRDGLQPVMTLTAPLIAIKHCQVGDALGYGGSFVCPEDMPIGVVAIGYGDGYPRHASTGTPVLVNGARAPLLGRVSMDMITIDLRHIDMPQVGEEVVLWGAQLSVDEVARHAGTIGYELLCHGGCSVRREFVDDSLL